MKPIKLFKPLEPFKPLLSFLPPRGLGGFLGGFLGCLLFLLTSCGTKTERFANKMIEKLPTAISGGEITDIFYEGHDLNIFVEVDSKEYDFASLKAHPEATKKIRSYQLASYGEKTHIGHLLRMAYEEGYDVTLTYRLGKEKAKNDKQLSTTFTPFDLQDLFDKYSVNSPQLLALFVTIEYINMRMPHKVDDLTTEEKVYYKDGNLVFRYSIDTSNIDWALLVKSQDSLRKTLIDSMSQDSKDNEVMRGILKQCVAGGFSYVYEYQSKQDASKNVRFTFTPQELKGMLF